MYGCRRVHGRWLKLLFSVAFILATNRKKETHFNYYAEDDTIKQWFSNFSLLRTPFTAPKTTAEPFVLSKFFYYCQIRFGLFLV